MSTSTTASPSGTAEEVYDLLGIGFGPAGLAIAVAVAEHNAAAPGESIATPPEFTSLGGLQEVLGRSKSCAQLPGNEGDRTELDITKWTGTIKACFVEKYDQFRWHPGMMIEGSKMQISFLKDLATLRSPQSPYTFLNYLHSQSPSRLLSFISLSTFTPSRREYADYLAWAARKAALHLDTTGGHVSYSENVVSVEPVYTSDPDSDVKLLRVTSATPSGTITRTTRNLVLSTGGSPRLPPLLSTPSILSTGRILHSSAFVPSLPLINKHALSRSTPLRVAVIGSGQSSAEVFLALHSSLEASSSATGRAEIDLHIKSSALRPSDDSGFSNEVFDPAMSHMVFGLEERDRARVMKEAKGTNYSVVNPRTLDSIYETMYDQRVALDSSLSFHSGSPPPTDPILTIHPYSSASSASTTPDNGISLTFHNTLTGSASLTKDYDFVICGTGYERQGWKEILFPSGGGGLHGVFAAAETGSPSSLPTTPEQEKSETFSASSSTTSLTDSSVNTPPSSITSSRATKPTLEQQYPITESYRLTLPAKTKSGAEFKPKVWLQGSNEKTHGISDSLLSVLAVRSGEVLEDLLTKGNF